MSSLYRGWSVQVFSIAAPHLLLPQVFFCKNTSEGQCASQADLPIHILGYYIFISYTVFRWLRTMKKKVEFFFKHYWRNQKCLVLGTYYSKKFFKVKRVHPEVNSYVSAYKLTLYVRIGIRNKGLCFQLVFWGMPKFN